MNWEETAASFHVTTAEYLLSLPRMMRYQDARAVAPWLTPGDRPVVLLFLSHRWSSPEHPDGSGELLKSIQAFLGTLLLAVEATLAGRARRLELLPSIAKEGALQAQEVGRRLLDFGPFSAQGLVGRKARALLKEEYRQAGGDPAAFRAGLARRIAVWLDYVCMPQRPFAAADEQSEFDRTLQRLDLLAESATLVAFRDAADDYARRGWCLLEAFVGAGRSFARGLTVDIGRMSRGEDVWLPPPPAAAADPFSAKVMRETYELELAPFHDACAAWKSAEVPLVDHQPPDAWSTYRSLQGAAFLPAGADPNPFRPALDAVRELEILLVERWLMSGEPAELDLAAIMRELLAGHGVRCADADQLVLGFTLACNGWIAAFRNLFGECLAIACDVSRRPGATAGLRIAVHLAPLDPSVRALFGAVTPSSPATWYSRLSQSSGGPDAAIVRSVKAALAENPPRFEIRR